MYFSSGFQTRLLQPFCLLEERLHCGRSAPLMFEFFSLPLIDAKLTTICLILKWNRLFTDVPVWSFVSSLFNLFSVLSLSVKQVKDQDIQDAEALQTGKMNSNDPLEEFYV